MIIEGDNIGYNAMDMYMVMDMYMIGKDIIDPVTIDQLTRLFPNDDTGDRIIAHVGFLSKNNSPDIDQLIDDIYQAVDDEDIAILRRVAELGTSGVEDVDIDTPELTYEVEDMINIGYDLFSNDIIDKLVRDYSNHMVGNNIIAYAGFLSQNNYPNMERLINYITTAVNNKDDRLLNRLARYGSPYNNRDELLNPELPRLESTEVEYLPITGLASEYRENVGGTVWQRIVEEEKDYINMLMNSNRERERPDLNNPVGGLIDITDHISSLNNSFNQPYPSNWTVGIGISDNIYIEKESYDLTSLYREITRGHSNFAIAGGFPLSIVTGVKYSDVDLFMIVPDAKNNPQPNEWVNEIKSYSKDVLSSNNSGNNIVISGHSVTLTSPISSQLRYVSGREAYVDVQVILRVYHSLTEVLTGFDIGCCGVGLYNGRLYATKRAIYEIVNRTIMISMNRASTSYPYRLIKYGLKGFGLHVEGVESFEHINADYATDKTPSILEIIDLYIRYGGWIYRQLGNYRAAVNIKLPIGMTSDYSQVNNTGARDVLDYSRGDKVTNLSYLDKIVDKIIYVNPFRQGSLSFEPVKIPLREWVGSSAIIDESKLISDSNNEDVAIYSVDRIPLTLVRLHNLKR